MTNKPWVYIAGPYTSPDPCANTNAACTTFDWLMSTGLCVPICPHWSHFQHTLCPRPYADWIRYDLDLLELLHLSGSGAVLRLPGVSAGADGEVAFAEARGIPVFNSADNLLECLRGESAPHRNMSRSEPVQAGPVSQLDAMQEGHKSIYTNDL